MNPDAIIETKDLRKVFPGKGRSKNTAVEAVKGISFSVKKGEVFGLLGPNGAGKTTTMRMLSTLLTPTSGTAFVVGEDLFGDQRKIRRQIGYVSQVGGTQRESTGRENLMLQAGLYGMSAKEAKARVLQVMKSLNIEGFADRKTQTYSGGQRRLYDLAAGIIHQPELLFLDEPSTGLDPQNRAHVWEQVKKLTETGTTVFLTTHYLDEADALCDRIAIVDHGTIVALGTPVELKRQISGDVLTLGFANPPELNLAKQALVGVSFIRETQVKEEILHLFVEKGEENLPEIITKLHESKINVKTISLSRPSLDDVFLKLTGRSLRENE